MTTHKLNKKAIAVTGLPEGTYPCHTYENTLSLRDSISGTLCDAVGLPPGNWQLLGFAQDLTDADRAVYEPLLKSEGLYVSNPYPNPKVKQPMCRDCADEDGTCPNYNGRFCDPDLRQEQWQSAQELTNPLILIIE